MMKHRRRRVDFFENALGLAKAGKTMVVVVALNAPKPSQRKRIGFLAGQITVPEAEAFNTMGSEEIAALFGGDR